MSSSRPATRVGWGFDAHRLDGEPPLKLAGVVVSKSIGVSATSDGDVVAHAVTDALLGAAVLGDLGDHFPSDHRDSQGADSMGFLRTAVAMASQAGWQADHVDVTVIAQSIRVAPHRREIAGNLAVALSLDIGAVSVKATTTDELGSIGAGHGLAAIAVLTAGALT